MKETSLGILILTFPSCSGFADSYDPGPSESLIRTATIISVM